MPSAGSCAEPGGQGVKPPEAENLSGFGCPTEAANFPHYRYFANSLNPRSVFVIDLSTN